MLIFYQLLPYCYRRRLVVFVIVGVLLSFLASCLWCFVVEVGGGSVLSLSLFCHCRQRCPFLWLHLSAYAPRRRRRLVIGSGGGGVTSIKTYIYFLSYISTIHRNKHRSIRRIFSNIPFHKRCLA